MWWRSIGLLSTLLFCVFLIMAVPLPPALILFGTALVGMTFLGRRRRKSNLNVADVS